MITILVVDDNPYIRELLSLAYDDRYKIIEADNGKEAIVAFENYHPEIVITSLKLKEISGLDLISNLRKLSSTVKIIVYDDFFYTSSQTALDTGADIAIPKMSGFTELNSAIKKLCGKSAKKN